MKILNNRKTAVFLLFVTCILYILLSLSVNIPLKGTTHNIWNGYYTLALENNAPVSKIINDLQLKGGLEVVSKYNSKIKVFNYNSDKFITISELEDYYISEDPLYDPFLKKLPLLFTGKLLSEKYQIVYIKSNLSSIRLFKKIENILKIYSINWFLPEITPGHQFLNTIIFLFGVILLFIWHKELWPVLISGVFPWYQFSYGAGLPGVLVSIIFLFSMVLLGSVLFRSFRHYLNLGIFDPVDNKKLAVSIFIMVISFIYLLINLKGLAYVGAFVISVAAHFSFIAFYLIILDSKRKFQQHRIFFPVRIKFSSIKVSRLDLYSFCSFMLLIILSPMIIGGNKFESSITLPVPVPIEGISDYSKSSMQILHTHSIESEIPNLSDYISHMMYLETYSYGFDYSFPEPDKHLSVSRFSLSKDLLKEKNVNIYIFTESWYQSIMDFGLTTGYINLLLSQGSPTLVAYQSEFGNLLDGNYIRNHYWFSIILVLAIIVWSSNFSPSGWYVFKEFLLRRKQQVV